MSNTTVNVLYKFHYNSNTHKIECEECVVSKETEKVYMVQNSLRSRIHKNEIGELDKTFLNMYLTTKDTTHFAAAVKAFYETRLVDCERKKLNFKSQIEMINAGYLGIINKP